MERSRNRNIRKRHSARLKRITVISAAVVIFAILIGWLIVKKTAVGGNVFSAKAELPFYTDDEFISNSKIIVYKKGSSIKGIDAKAKEIFSIDNVGDDAKMYISDKNVGYFVKNACFIYNLDGKEICRYETKDSISDIRLTDEYVAMIKTDSSGKSYLVLNDFKQGEKFSMEIDTGNLLDFGVISSSATVWTLSLNTSIQTPLCVFTAYNSGKNNIHSIINIAEQLPEKLLVNSDKVYALGTGNLITYDLSGKKEQTYLTYGWKVTDYMFTGAKPYFVLIPRTDEPITSVRIRHSDSTEYTFTLQEECNKVIIGNNKIYAFNENKLFYTDLKGEKIKKTDTPFKMKGIHSVLGGTHIIADNGGSFVLFNLK